MKSEQAVLPNPCLEEEDDYKGALRKQALGVPIAAFCLNYNVSQPK
jgi:hypothetical protein